MEKLCVLNQPQLVQAVQQTSQPQQIIIQRTPQPINQVQLVQQAPAPAANTQQQIVVGNSLGQMLAQGKVQVVTLAGGQQAIIRYVPTITNNYIIHRRKNFSLKTKLNS